MHLRRQAFTSDFYTLRERGADEIFPWDFINIGVTEKISAKRVGALADAGGNAKKTADR